MEQVWSFGLYHEELLGHPNVTSLRNAIKKWVEQKEEMNRREREIESDEAKADRFARGQGDEDLNEGLFDDLKPGFPDPEPGDEFSPNLNSLPVPKPGTPDQQSKADQIRNDLSIATIEYGEIEDSNGETRFAVYSDSIEMGVGVKDKGLWRYEHTWGNDAIPTELQGHDSPASLKRALEDFVFGKQHQKRDLSTELRRFLKEREERGETDIVNGIQEFLFRLNEVQDDGTEFGVLLDPNEKRVWAISGETHMVQLPDDMIEAMEEAMEAGISGMTFFHTHPSGPSVQHQILPLSVPDLMFARQYNITVVALVEGDYTRLISV